MNIYEQYKDLPIKDIIAAHQHYVANATKDKHDVFVKPLEKLLEEHSCPEIVRYIRNLQNSRSRWIKKAEKVGLLK